MEIKDLRNELGLTQQEFADSIKIERSLYSKIESGKNRLTAEQIKNVIKVHSVNPRWILFGEGDMFSEKNTIEQIKSGNESGNFSGNKNGNSLPLSTKIVNTDIHFSEEKALETLENEGLRGRRVYISPEPASAGSLSSYITEGTGSEPKAKESS